MDTFSALESAQTHPVGGLTFDPQRTVRLEEEKVASDLYRAVAGVGYGYARGPR